MPRSADTDFCSDGVRVQSQVIFCVGEAMLRIMRRLVFRRWEITFSHFAAARCKECDGNIRPGEDMKERESVSIR